MAHRRAYYPRLWPLLLTSAAIGAVALELAWRFGWRGFAPGLVVGVVVSAGVVKTRLWLWRRKHPIITPQEQVDDLRAKAIWN